VRRIFFCNYRPELSLSTYPPVTTKDTGKYDSIGDKKKKACVRIQRVKTDSFFYPADIHVKDEIIRRYPQTTNKLICFMKMSQGMEIVRTKLGRYTIVNIVLQLV